MFQSQAFLKLFEEISQCFSSFSPEEETYFLRVSEEDCSFLVSFPFLSDFSPSEKMGRFHSFFQLSCHLSFLKSFQCEESYVQSIFPYKGVIKAYQSLPDLSKSEINIFLENAYPSIVNSLSRKSSGTEFTPHKVVSFMLDSIDYKGSILTSTLLEPSCGSGAFLIPSLERFLSSAMDHGVRKEELLSLLFEKKALVGIDTNPSNVFVSKLRYLLTIDDYFNEEFKAVSLIEMLPSIPVFLGDALRHEGQYDFVVGNPPYIRLQRLHREDREYVKRNFKSATGRFDLYVCFFEKAINLLRDGGKMSFITSNKFMTASYGLGIRDYILEHLKITLLFDLADTKIFGASVLPSILSGIKEVESDYLFPFLSLKQSNLQHQEEISISNPFEKSFELLSWQHPVREHWIMDDNISTEFSFSYVEKPKSHSFWNFSYSDDETLKQLVEKSDSWCLGDISDVCVGVKTTADDVFVKPMTKNFVKEKKLESDICKPLIQSKNIKKWKVEWTGNEKSDRYILYPHFENDGKTFAVNLDSYPFAKSYLELHKSILNSREYIKKAKSREWYECWVPQKPSKFSCPKIVTKDIADTNTFALDLSGHICQGNTFFIYLKNGSFSEFLSDEEALYYLLGVMNSTVMEFYHKTISGSLYEKKVRYTTTNLTRWLIPKVSKNNICLVKSSVELARKLSSSPEEARILEDKLNDCVFSLFSIDEINQNKMIEFIKTNS